MPNDQLPTHNAVGIIIDDGENLIFQERDSIDGIYSPGVIGLWGGSMEPIDESNFTKAALRELREETGLTEADVTIECFGEINREFETLAMKPVNLEMKLFVAKLKSKIAIHVYEGKKTYILNMMKLNDDNELTNLGEDLVNAIHQLKGYYGYKA